VSLISDVDALGGMLLTKEAILANMTNSEAVRQFLTMNPKKRIDGNS
jgi:hypothetical protein